MKRIVIAAAAALAMMGTAHAQQRSPLYGELGYSFQTFEIDSIGYKANPQAIRGIIGYDFHRNFALEGMLAFGTSGDSDMGVEVKTRHAIGFFAKPKFDMGPVEAFARLGWVRTSARVSGGGLTATGDDNDFAYGVGVNYNFNPKMYIGVDYMRLMDKDGAKIDGVTVGFGYRF